MLTNLRTGTNKLRIETGRWKRPVEKPEERICRQCNNAEIEDEKHFILKCEKYRDLRDEMLTKFAPSLKTRSHDEQWSFLMGEAKKPRQTHEVIKVFVRRAMKRRVPEE